MVDETEGTLKTTIDVIAFKSALEAMRRNKSEGNTIEIERALNLVVQGIRSAPQGTIELLLSTENLLSALHAGVIESNQGTMELLEEVIAFLETHSHQDDEEISKDRIDELLERLDYVASGGLDEEVPRFKEKFVAVPPEPDLPEFPVSMPTGFEDPYLVDKIERLSSLNRRSQVFMDEPNSNKEFLKLLRSYAEESKPLLDRFDSELYVDIQEWLKDLIESVVAEVGGEEPTQSLRVKINSKRGSLYKSTSIALGLRIQSLLRALLHLKPTEESVDLTVKVEQGENFVLNLQVLGLSFRSDEIEQANTQISCEARLSQHFSLNTEFPKPEHSPIENLLLATRNLRSDCRLMGGSFDLESNEEGVIDFRLCVPSHSRLIQVLPVDLNGDWYYLETHHICALNRTTDLEWDAPKRNVVFQDKHYRHVSLATESSRRLRPFTCLIALDGERLAFNMNGIGDVEILALRPAASQITLGHRVTSHLNAGLLIDPRSLVDANRRPVFKPHITDAETIRGLFWGVSEVLIDKVLRVFDEHTTDYRTTTSRADTLREFQECRPTILCLQDSPGMLDGLDSLVRVSTEVDLTGVQILVFTDQKCDLKDVYSLETVDYGYYSPYVQFADLKEFLCRSPNSSESDAVSMLD